jgi:hypothetical protein
MRLFVFIFLKRKKDSRTSQISFLILVANKNNSKAILKSPSITWVCKTFTTFQAHDNGRHASNNNDWLLNWFKTHALTT